VRAFWVSATAQMRALVTLVAVALVGLAVGAHSAAAGSKKPGISISVDLGPASVKVDASSDGANASADVSTPAASVDATVDSSTQAPVSATVDASTPVGGATVDATTSASDPSATAAPVRIEAKAQVKSPLASGKVAVSTRSGHVEAAAKVSAPVGRARTAVHATTAGPSNAGSPAIATSAATAAPAVTRAASTPAPAVRPRAHRELLVAAPRAKATVTPAAAPTSSRGRLVDSRPASKPLSGIGASFPASTRPASEAVPGATGNAPVAASTWSAPTPRPASEPASGGPGGASGSGLSTVGFFAILTALLMLAAPVVGRWLRPTLGLALQPAFASLPERPG
jgi:hypothetical protein